MPELETPIELLKAVEQTAHEHIPLGLMDKIRAAIRNPRASQTINAVAYDKVLADREALLEVLQTTLQAYEETKRPHFAVLRDARAAIAKAKGQSS